MDAMDVVENDFPGPVIQLHDLHAIDSALEVVAQELNQRFQGQSVTVINILQGGMVTTANLLVKLTFLVELDSIYATRYRNRTEGYELEWKQYPSTDLNGKTVILVDDIFDEGVTISKVKQYCLDHGAKEVIVVILLDKQHARKLTPDKPDYVALSVPDVYVFGFGLDYHGRYRNAPGIYALDKV